MEQRVKRWLASCGFDRGTRTGKLEQPNARRERWPCVFLLRFVSRTLSAEQRRSAWHSPKAVRNERKSLKNRSKIDEKSMKFRSWAVWAPGPARGRTGTRLECPRSAKLGCLGRQIGRLGRLVGCSGHQVGNLERQVGPLGLLPGPCRSRCQREPFSEQL